MTDPQTPPETSGDKGITRRTWLAKVLRGAALAAMGLGGGYFATRAKAEGTLWQIDPKKCNACGRCQSACVLNPSAVKCVHAFSVCGYCRLCTGYFIPQPAELDTGAENQLCPTGAIQRTFIEDPYFEYKINEKLCIGCAQCVGGCTAFGNGSLFLQIRHDRCVHCNHCAIERVCPTGAIVRVSADHPYLLKGQEL